MGTHGHTCIRAITFALLAGISIPAQGAVSQNTPLLAALVQAGGGRTHFDAMRLRRVLVDNRCPFGKRIKQFDHAFTFVVNEAIAHRALPPVPANLSDGEGLRRALFAAGEHDGSFDVEQLFDVLFTAPVHIRQMVDVAKKYGGDVEAAYHTVFTCLVAGPRASAGLHEHNMAVNPKPRTTMSPMPAMSPMPSMSPMPVEMPMSRNGGTFSLKGMNAQPSMRMTAQQMPDTTNLLVGMGREGSGTSWMPDVSPIYARMWMKGDDMWMQHGAAWLRYSHAGSQRGSDRVTAPTWYMFMVAHPISARSQIGFRAMLSADAALVGGSGYPLLFQTGETWHNQPLHDRQHPHDLVDELSATYSATIGTKTAGYLYLAYPGEPALGPPAFMHRAVAYDLADAPVGHHWQDATHISFGVATLGVGTERIKLEGSLFNGREPNEVRTDFDPIRLDSSSLRLSWNPNAFTAFQVSAGNVKSMEAADPTMNMRRTTASFMYERQFMMAQWSQALVWGQNVESGQRTNSLLYEADYATRSGSLFGRIENVQKSGKDLALSSVLSDQVFTIGAYTLGYLFNLPSLSDHPIVGIGAQFTVNSKPSSLDPYYGAGAPLSYQLFVRIHGSKMEP